MLNPKDQQYAERIKELIEEGQVIATLEKPTKKPGIKTIQDNYRLQKWLTNVEQIVKTTFGQNSLQFQNLSELLKGSTYYASAVRGITGLLAGALEDLEKGFLLEKEILIAGEIFKSVLDQASYLLEKGHKDPAAMLARVALEDALKRMARQEIIDDKQNTSKLNDELKNLGRYKKHQWRTIQSWLDIGNSAAHGQFYDYTTDNIKNLIEDIEEFIDTELMERYTCEGHKVTFCTKT